MALDIKAHLERVSRSFAFCIARLDEPLREQVGLAYLLCRILDTVEDAEWLDPELQMNSFDGFISMLAESRLAAPWSQSLLSNAQRISENEKMLILETDLVLDRLSLIFEDARRVMIPPVISMAQGMREFAENRSTNHGRLQLQTLREVNHYCFFVAGVVGEILDGLLRVEAQKRGVIVETKLSDGFRFGLFLQKVNLMKDRESDLAEGRDLVPVPADVFRSALEDAKRAFAYIQAIPIEFKNYRLFCSWSLFLGLASLPHIAKKGKIGRIETAGLLAKVEFKIGSRGSLEALFDEYLALANSASSLVGESPPRELSLKLSQEPDSKPVEEIGLASYRTCYVGAARDEDLSDLIDCL
jgi:phytoene/squalene synthetase